jgi:hypothetical protein
MLFIIFISRLDVVEVTSGITEDDDGEIKAYSRILVCCVYPENDGLRYVPLTLLCFESYGCYLDV